MAIWESLEEEIRRILKARAPQEDPEEDDGNLLGQEDLHLEPHLLDGESLEKGVAILGPRLKTCF